MYMVKNTWNQILFIAKIFSRRTAYISFEKNIHTTNALCIMYLKLKEKKKKNRQQQQQNHQIQPSEGD